ncbi:MULTISPECIES: hypothetical protein [Microvirga]|uniref:hypothetical protein n=1 Tax=Microvirga TaxID=186650 RepID=UPI001CFF8DFE|nr:hypothetical protein [Microvirga lenta]MCB5176194.1 hypothetical protein [Microvirga lenta]
MRHFFISTALVAGCLVGGSAWAQGVGGGPIGGGSIGGSSIGTSSPSAPPTGSETGVLNRQPSSEGLLGTPGSLNERGLQGTTGNLYEEGLLGVDGELSDPTAPDRAITDPDNTGTLGGSVEQSDDTTIVDSPLERGICVGC